MAVWIVFQNKPFRFRSNWHYSFVSEGRHSAKDFRLDEDNSSGLVGFQKTCLPTTKLNEWNVVSRWLTIKAKYFLDLRWLMRQQSVIWLCLTVKFNETYLWSCICGVSLVHCVCIWVSSTDYSFLPFSMNMLSDNYVAHYCVIYLFFYYMCHPCDWLTDDQSGGACRLSSKARLDGLWLPSTLMRKTVL